MPEPVHICMVCFEDAADHDGDANWPSLPPCCYGCGCGTEEPPSGTTTLGGGNIALCNLGEVFGP